MAYDDDIIAFIKARLDEDEATATAATPGPWRAPCGPDDDDAVIEGRDGHVVADSHSCPDHPYRGAADALHIIRHDPARVLREVAAGRAIIERYKHARAAPPPNANFTAGQDDGYRQACADAIRDLTAAWGDHPDYRQEWRP